MSAAGTAADSTGGKHSDIQLPRARARHDNDAVPTVAESPLSGARGDLEQARLCFTCLTLHADLTFEVPVLGCMLSSASSSSLNE